MDGSRPALVVPRLSRAAHECAPALSARSLGSGARRHHQAYRCSHPAAQLCHPSLGAKDRYPDHPGPARTQEARHDGAVHARRHQRDRRGDKPARCSAEDARLTAAVVTAGGRGGGHLPPPRAGLACVSCRPYEPRPTQGHVSDRTLRGVRPPAHLLQFLPQPQLRCLRLHGIIERLPNTQYYHAPMPAFVPRSSSPEPTIVSFAQLSQPPCQATAPPQLASNKPSTTSISASLHRSTNSHWPHET